jgi:hypothetical protein
MATNLKKEIVQRGMRLRANWPLTVGMPGVALFVYCSGSIPTDLSFDGSNRLEHRAAETQTISNSRQLQL